MIGLQYYTFWWQNFFSTIVFVPSLITISVLVNVYPWWAYDPHVILKNEEFNIVITTTIFMGVLSLALAKNPSWMGWTIACKKGIYTLEKLDEFEAKSQETLNFDDVDGTRGFNLNAYKNHKPGLIDIDNMSQKNTPTTSNELRNGSTEPHFKETKRQSPTEEPIVLRSHALHQNTIKLQQIANSINYRQSISFQRMSSVSNDGERKSVDLVTNDCVDGNLKKSSSWQQNVETPNIWKGSKEKRFPKEILIRVLIGFGCIIFVLSPIIAASTFMDLSNDRTVYIYYTDENETTITQVRISYNI